VVEIDSARYSSEVVEILHKKEVLKKISILLYAVVAMEAVENYLAHQNVGLLLFQ
jgi:hypothetical protein